MDDFNSFTIFNETDFGLNESINLNPVNINLLPGEKFKQFDLLNYGCRFGLTNYRIIIISDIIIKGKNENLDKYNIVSIPLGLIYHIEFYGMVHVSILTKIGCNFNITFPDYELCEKTLQKIKESRFSENYFGNEFYRALKDSFPTHFLLSDDHAGDDWKDELDTIENEFERLKFPSEFWRISQVNKDFKVCTSYPKHHIILKEFNDASVKEMAKFRSKGRFISAVYRSIDTGAVLLRSGQPLTGVSSWRNESDEKYFSLITNLTKTDHPQMIIFDARSYTSAQLNKVKGGGLESEAYYPSTSVEFLSIPNMHTVRSSFESLSSAMAGDNKNFYDLLDKSTWLLLIRDLLKSANSICNMMHSNGKSVLVHCSDGWDRTPQLTSLAMVLMDPFYRTIKGFKILIQREWIYFGHRFNERCAMWNLEPGREFSPIFLQWLDCIHQLQLQFPDHFEFNEKFLIKLALHVYSSLFGTFNKSIPHSGETCSLWNFLCYREFRAFLNPFYQSNKTFNIMKPVTHIIEMKLWVGLYRDALDPNFRYIYASENLNRDLPPEFDHLVMFNSIMENKDQEDDYQGEDSESIQEPALSIMENAKLDENGVSYNGMSPNEFTKTNEKVDNSYFRNYSIKCSLESVEEIKSSNEVQIFQEIDIDGLFIQRDILFNFSEINRQNRHLLRGRIQYYKSEVHKICQLLSKETEKSIENDVVNTDIDSNSSENINLEDFVRWVPDHSVNNCTSCTVYFSIFNRKHHCRSCGKIFCQKCSAQKSKIKKEKISWPERVCDACYLELNKDNEACVKKTLQEIFYDLLRSPWSNNRSS